MAAALPFIMLAGTAVTAFGQFQQGQAAAQASQYNSNMANQNAAIQKKNAEIAGQAGAQQAAMQSMKTRAAVGQEIANQGASGVTINDKDKHASTAAVTLSERQLGMLDATQVRNNATKEAYGYTIQSENDKAQAQLDRFQASTEKTGSYLNAGGTLLSGAGSAYKAYQQGQSVGV